MVDITVVLSLQGRARRNARSSMLRLRQERADAAEAAAAVASASGGEAQRVAASEAGGVVDPAGEPC